MSGAMVAAQADTIPLCVDLDGTVIQTDLLHEALLALVKTSPRSLVALPARLAGGKARLKAWLAATVEIDAARLPYRADLLDYLRAERAGGRSIHLVTASPIAWASKVADHLQLFDAIDATGDDNLRGSAKADMLVARYGRGGFDYVGDSRADLPVWDACRRCLRAGRGAGIALKPPLEAGQTFASRSGAVRPILKALRPHQWAKNLLVFVPLVASHTIGDPVAALLAVATFACFCLAASGTYIFNDLFDLAADRAHPRKRNRPFAAGDVPVAHGAAIGLGLLAASVILALAISPAVAVVLVVYVATTTAYSLRLKRAALVDVFTLAGLYSIRMVGGGVATGIRLSIWLLAFSIFLFLCLAMIKRCGELSDADTYEDAKVKGRGYYGDDRHVVTAAASASAFCAVLVLALYTTQRQVIAAYRSPELLWFVCPVLLYWLVRMILLANRGHMHDDPIIFTARDVNSRILILLCAGIGWVAASFDVGISRFIMT